GALHQHPNVRGPEGFPELLPIQADASTVRIAGDRWHSDVSCDPEPPMGSILHLHEVPARGGDTLFCNTEAAFAALSPGLQQYLQGLTATHDGEHVYRSRNRNKGIDDTGRHYPRSSHPVVRTHPETGRKGLFVNANFTTHINDVPREESEAVLAFLYQHLARPEFQVRFRWQPHSVAFWDNRSTQHLAVWDYYPARRAGHRVTLRGDRPFQSGAGQVACRRRSDHWYHRRRYGWTAARCPATARHATAGQVAPVQSGSRTRTGTGLLHCQLQPPPQRPVQELCPATG